MAPDFCTCYSLCCNPCNPIINSAGKPDKFAKAAQGLTKDKAKNASTTDCKSVTVPSYASSPAPSYAPIPAPAPAIALTAISAKELFK